MNSAKKSRIKKTLQATKDRRVSMTCKVIECVNLSFNRAPIIALHDHGLKAARLGFFKNLNKYDNYELVMLDIAHPTTSLFISDVKLLSVLKKHEKYVNPVLDKWY